MWTVYLRGKKGGSGGSDCTAACAEAVVLSPVVAGVAASAGSNEIALFASYAFERKWTWYPSGYSLESTTTSATSRSAACRTSPRTVNAELITRNERSVDEDRPPITAADVTRRRIGVVVDDDTDRLCGRTVIVDDDDNDEDGEDAVDSDDGEGTEEGGVATFPTPPDELGAAAFVGSSLELTFADGDTGGEEAAGTGSAGTVRSITPR